MEIWEGKYPASVDKEQVEDFFKNVCKPAYEKAGYKRLRFGWMSIGGPMNMGVLLGELESLADIERVWTVEEVQQAGKEFGQRFPGAELTRRILEMID